MDDLWFRVEHERTKRIREFNALLISVDVFPRKEQDGELLKKCIDSMSDNFS